MLERLGDVDHRRALLARRQRRRHPVDDDVGAAARQHLLGRDVRAAGLDRHVEPFVLVEALVLGDVIAGELRLRDPFELQRHLVVGLRRARDSIAADAGECEYHRFHFALSVEPDFPLAALSQTAKAQASFAR